MQAFLYKTPFRHTTIMLLLTKGNTADHIVVTLKEKTTLLSCYYLFVCEHITTKEVIKFIIGPVGFLEDTNGNVIDGLDNNPILLTGADLSSYPDRYNEFIINTNAIFTGATTGQWLYKVYEQGSSTNLDETGLNLVENGKLNYKSDTPLTYTQYQPSTIIKAYAG